MGIKYLRKSAMIAIAAAFLGIAGAAHADTTHVVGRGHTLQAIANRYHVSVKAILAANPDVDARHLRIGETLTIPNGANAKTASSTAGNGESAQAKREHREHRDQVEHGKHEIAHTASYAARPKQPHVVHAVRLNSGEAITLTTSDRRGRVPPATLKSMENLMKSSGNLGHAPDARLIALFGVVSDHFGGRKIEVVSGFRPYTPTQYTPHSNHNVGKAIDFRVVGVPNEVLRDFCKTLHNVGCGYYPNSTFVHMDVRSTSATWIDYSRPGEAPKYDGPGGGSEADDTTSDVAEDNGGASPGEDNGETTSAPAVTGAGSAPAAGAAPVNAAPATAAAPAAPASPSKPAAPGAGAGAAATAAPLR